MASNNLASIAAATAAGYKLRRPGAQGKFVTELSIQLQGQPGVQGQEYTASGESVVSSAAADTAALAALNAWRANRYGSDSAGQNVSTVQTAATSQSTQGVAPSHSTLTKDKN